MGRVPTRFLELASRAVLIVLIALCYNTSKVDDIVLV